MRTSAYNHRHAERGTTLFELLIALALLAVAFAAIGSVARPASSESAVEEAMLTVVSTMELARVHAIASGTVVSVVIDPFDRRIGVPEMEQVVQLDRRLDVSARVAQEASRGAGAAILFYPDGTSTGGSITLAAGAAESEVAVHWLTGTIHARR